MSTPDSWRRPDHWKLGDPSRWQATKPEPEPRLDWAFVLEALVLAVVVFGAIVVMSIQ